MMFIDEIGLTLLSRAVGLKLFKQCLLKMIFMIYVRELAHRSI